MDWLKDNFGGNVYQQRNNQYYIYRWRIHSEAAEKFLIFIRPYVLIKKPQVEFAIMFNQERKERSQNKGRSSRGTWTKLTEEELQWRINQKAELSLMKKRYSPYTRGEVKIKEE